jgi:hypothetical protein
MKTYYIFTIYGGDCVSGEFKTHKEATWHLWHDSEYEMEDFPDRRKVYYVKEMDNEENIECPSCGADGDWTCFDGDSYVCDKCHHCW